MEVGLGRHEDVQLEERLCELNTAFLMNIELGITGNASCW